MGKLEIRLLADRVLVRVEDQGELVTNSGIIIPDSATEEAALEGTILSVSTRIEKCEVEEDKVYVGEKILFSKYAGSDLRYGGDDYKIMRITDVFGAVDDE